MAQPMVPEKCVSSAHAQILSEEVPSGVSADEEELERKHFEEVVAAFRHYRIFLHIRLNQKLKDFDALPHHHQLLLPGFQDHIGDVRHCVDHNYEIIKLIIENTDCMFVNRNECNNTDKENKPKRIGNGVAKLDMEKVLTTIKQFVRDWSEEGATERQTCYQPIIDEIQRRLPVTESKERISVLVPGAGLGRLAFEIAKLGYNCQGNEFSLFMLFASHFILNRSPEVNGLTFYPWAHHFSNIKTSEQQTRGVRIPDISPSSLDESADFSMVAGDFLEVYTTPETWDCVATCFFIDTAHNILAYVEKIFEILKPGGYWINLGDPDKMLSGKPPDLHYLNTKYAISWHSLEKKGPLLYHFENITKEQSIEIAYDVLRKVIIDFSFVILREDSIHTSYLQDQSSMLKYEYDCVFLVCQKPLQRNEPTQEAVPESEKQ